MREERAERSGRRRHLKRGERTRADILEVAGRLFADYGYHHTGIADLQDATGLTKGAFYHHFRSKQEVALAAVGVMAEEIRREVMDRARSGPDLGMDLGLLLDALGKLAGSSQWRHGRLLVMLCMELSESDGVLRQAVLDMLAGLRNAMVEGVAAARASGSVDSGLDDSEAADWILQALMGAMVVAKAGIGIRPAGDLFRRLVGRFLSAT